MRVLLKKETAAFFSSATGIVAIGVFLLLTGAFLWWIPGSSNVLESGYANLDGLFALAPWLYLFLIPALTMRLFPDEKRNGTMELLLTHPVSRWQIVLAKYLAAWLVAVVALLLTCVYMVSVCCLGAPFANMDFGAYWGSFIGLVLLAAVYVAVGTCASALTDNPVVAFLAGALFCFLMYYGFDLLALLLPGAALQDAVVRLGIASHYESMSRGVIDTRDLLYFATVVLLFLGGAYKAFGGGFSRKVLIAVAVVMLVDTAGAFVFTRLDLTSEKRYTLSENTKTLLRSTDEPVEAVIYLDGDLNMGFLRLKKSVRELLSELRVYAGGTFEFTFVNPSEAAGEEERQQQYARLAAQGMQPTMVHDRDSEGRIQQKIIFPWMRLRVGGDTLNVCLLQNISGNSGEENLNVSIESLEYVVTDAIRVLTNRHPLKIAFLEGHGELPEAYVYDLSDRLARYYQVDRGVLGADASVLDDYRVVIVAAPQEGFSERDKFILDQYIMRGGRVLWLIDGVVYRHVEDQQVVMANATRLEDLLFTYGVRIAPVLVSDVQCAYVPVNMAGEGEEAQFEAVPWYYAPLLMPSPHSMITKNTAPVKADFASALEFVGEPTASLKREVLLITSDHAGVESVPMLLDMDFVVGLAPDDSSFFANWVLPVAVSLEGTFPSVFSGRMVPENVEHADSKPLTSSKFTKMIVVADGDIAANEVIGRGQQTQTLPLGYDRYMDKRFGNADFLVNAVNYLADDEGWLDLRGRELQIRLLDKTRISRYRLHWQVFNTLFPILLLITFGGVCQWIRRKKYKK
ncbi:MAG: gliding motility-associated ABC transporter substrate-binding protein GldG [Paludibacteraceae bacterium]|nr:gliding motility-associated ABC transporter substrate-binding protein GldG [Paludibacteraceae bacterium]